MSKPVFAVALNRPVEGAVVNVDDGPETHGRAGAWFPFLRSLSDEAAEILLTQAFLAPMPLNDGDDVDGDAEGLRREIRLYVLRSLPETLARHEAGRHHALLELLRAMDAQPADCHDCLRGLVMPKWYTALRERANGYHFRPCRACAAGEKAWN